MKRYSFIYSVTEGLRGIFTHGVTSVGAVVVTAACLLIIGSFFLVGINVNKVISDAEKKNEVVAFISEDSTEAQRENIKSAVLAIEGVGGADFKSKEDAFDEYLERFKGYEYESILEGFEDDNPLRDSFTVHIDELERLGEIGEALKRIDGVEYVRMQEEVANGLIGLRSAVYAVALVLALVLASVSVLIVSNNTRLAAFSRREEIAIMRTVGATNTYIRGSFMVEGVALGLLAGGISFFAQKLIYERFIYTALIESPFMWAMHFSTVAPYLLAAFGGAGILVGLAGSLLAINRFLKV